MFDSKDIDRLDRFILDFKDCGIEGLERDYDAVNNSLIYRHVSNGPSEGNNSRIKMLHRRSTGRAGLDLKELVRNIGIQFDPKVVLALVELVKNKSV